MADRPFRFLHTSDFHLEQPLYGVANIPEHLRAIFLDAPFQAVQKIFELALQHEVDFVVLAGDIVDFHRADPRAAMFLADQFQRLATQDIMVYWLEGEMDRAEDWPAAVILPRNVRIFRRDRSAQEIFERDGSAVARIVGVDTDGPAEANHDSKELFTVAIQHGELDSAVLPGVDVGYWAMGGDHSSHTFRRKKFPGVFAHYPGTPQGRCPSESAVHGVTLVHVETDGETRLESIDADIVTWVEETIEIADDASRDNLREMLALRTSELIDENAHGFVMISWTIAGGRELFSGGLGGRVEDELIHELRQEMEKDTRAWTVSLDWLDSENVPEEWYEEDSLRGEYLRQVQSLIENEENDLLFEPHCYGDETKQQRIDPYVADLLVADDPDEREQCLQEVAALGAELLSGKR